MNTAQEVLDNWAKRVNKSLVLTVFDLDRIPADLDYDQTINYIKEYLAVSHVDLDFVNQLYTDAILYLQAELFYTDSELWDFKKTKFNSVDEIVEFIASTRKLKWKKRCTIIKQMLALCEWSSKYNPRISEVVEKTTRVVENKLKWPLQINYQSDDGSYLEGVVVIWERVIPFTMKVRLKSDESRIAKGIKDPLYTVQENISDEYGITFELDSVMDIPIFMDYIAKKSFKRGVYNIKSKWVMFSESDRDMILADTQLSWEFKKRFLKALTTSSKKEQTPSEYSDVKLETPYFKDDNTNNLSLEIKFVKSWNSNEKWISMQGIYGYFKKLEQRIRMEQFIHRDYIWIVVDNFLANLQEILDKNIGREEKDLYTYKKELFNDLKQRWFIDQGFNLNQEATKKAIDSHIRAGLVGYYRDLLRPVTTTTSKDRNKYYTSSRWVEISKITDFWQKVLVSQD